MVSPSRVQLPRWFAPTHNTAGLDGFPAVDLFAPAGALVLAPTAVELVWPHRIEWSRERRVGGVTVYLVGRWSTWFLTHLGYAAPRGHYGRGDVIGSVGAVPNRWWAEHVHYGKHKGPYRPPYR